MKIATSPLFYKGAAFFMPEKMGNLHLQISDTLRSVIV